MNTEQLKTPQQHIVDLTRKSYEEDFKGMNDSDTLLQITRGNSELFIRAMQDFASQEGNKAVSEFKRKLISEVTKRIDDHHSIGSMEVLTEREIFDLIDKL